MSNFVLYEVKDRVGYITLNRPEKRNALNAEFMAEIKTVFGKAETDNNCKVIVLRANGPSFCAGADLEYLQDLNKSTSAANLADSKNLMRLLRMIYLSPKVVISQVNGAAVAGGCGLATVCDFSFATPSSTFGYSEVKIGFVPAIVMVFLIRKIGENHAKQLLLTGDLVDGDLALQLGLINYLVTPSSLEDEVTHFAQKLCTTTSGQSLSIAKEMLNRIENLNLRDDLNYASEMNVKARGSEDYKRGITAFLNKEKITW
ncbi:MAG: enoyl-CoA hydratase/isomerase family protein [Bacteroidia bacterium]